MIETSRRSLITGLISLMAAPAIVRASSLMPVSSKFMIFDYDELVWITRKAFTARLHWTTDGVIEGMSITSAGSGYLEGDIVKIGREIYNEIIDN